MKKKKLVIAVGIVFLVFCIGLLLAFRQKLVQKKAGEQISSTTATPALKEELLAWDDPAGFSFKYSKGVTIDKHDEDTENYAHIEFTNPDHKGRVIVWAKDTLATTIAEWLKAEKSLKDATSIDTTLGGNEAKKIIVKEPNLKQITATLDEDIVIFVEAELEDQEYWQNVNDIILKSFSFSASGTASGDASGNEEPAVAADEEESLE